jgi:hypothetical protein
MSKLTQTFFEAYYANCLPDDGHIVIVSPMKCRIVGAFGLHQIQEASFAANRERGCYFKTQLGDLAKMQARLTELRRDNPKASIVGNRDEIKTIVSFSLDCDANKSGYLSRGDMLAAIDAMPVRPSFIINSDHHAGGFHCYWLLQSPYRLETDGEREYISTLARRWQNRLKDLAGGKLDTTGDITRMLRVPGSIRQNGNQVSFHRFRPEWRYTLRELTLEESPQEIQERERAILKRQLAAIDANAGDDAIMEYIKSQGLTPEIMLSEAGYEDQGGGQWRRPGSKSGARTLKIADHAPGINVFSDADHEFSKFMDSKRHVHIADMFTAIYFAGNGTKAKAFCASEIENELNKSVNLEGLK